MKTFYKLNPLQLGSGIVIPEGFTEYIIGQEPKGLLDARANKLQDITNAEQAKISSRLSAIASLESATGLSTDTIKQALQ